MFPSPDEGSNPSSSTTQDNSNFFESCLFFAPLKPLSMLRVWRSNSLIFRVRHLIPSKLNFSGKVELNIRLLVAKSLFSYISARFDTFSMDFSNYFRSTQIQTKKNKYNTVDCLQSQLYFYLYLFLTLLTA